MSSLMLRLAFCFVLFAGLAGCGAGGSNGGSSGGGAPTIVAFTFSGPPPAALATQIGSGAYTQATLTSGKLTISVPSDQSDFSVAYLCPSPTAGPFVNQEYIDQANTKDGVAFSEACPEGGASSQGGLATAQVDASAIPGAEEIDVGSGGGCSACDTFNGSAFLAVGTYDVPVRVDGNGGPYSPPLAARILRGQTIPGALNGGAPVVFQTSDETVPQTITYNGVPDGYSVVDRTVVYNTSGGAFVQLELDDSGAELTQYLAMPSGTYQSGDYYDLLVSAANATGDATVSVETFTTSAGPQSFTFPAPLSYAGPPAAALPTFTFSYSGFSGMPHTSQQAAIYWGVGTWIPGIPEDLDSITMTATANHQNGSPAMTIPDLSSLTGFLAPAPSGTTVSWSAGYYQGDPHLTTPASGTIQSADSFGTYTEP